MRKVHQLVALVAALCPLGIGGTAMANRYFSPFQTALTLGGGVSDFAAGAMRATSQPGAEWDARVLFGTRSPIALEAGYAGTYNTLASDGARVGTSTVAPYMVQNSVDGALRINILPYRVQPFIFGGLGFNHAQVYNRDQNVSTAAQFHHIDDSLLVPAGGGLSAYFGKHATVDARFTYRAIINSDIYVPDPSVRLDQWTVAGRFGYAF